MSDSPTSRPRIPSADALLPLPSAALRLVQLARDWLPCEPPSAAAPPPRDGADMARAEVVHQASVVAGLIGRARKETGLGTDRVVASRWENVHLVLGCVNRLAGAVGALLDNRGWAGLWRAGRWMMASEGVNFNGKLLSEADPPPGYAVIVESKSFAPVPATLLDAVEQAARLLYQELRPTIAVMNAESAPAAAEETSATKPKRSTQSGEAREKIIAKLTAHHQYAGGSCLNLEPIGNNDLARQAQVAPATVSAFFGKEFKGRGGYRAVCQEATSLVAALKLLRGEFSPHLLFERIPPGESRPDDDE